MSQWSCLKDAAVKTIEWIVPGKVAAAAPQEETVEDLFQVGLVH
jgi:hypothetical protein